MASYLSLTVAVCSRSKNMAAESDFTSSSMKKRHYLDNREENSRCSSAKMTKDCDSASPAATLELSTSGKASSSTPSIFEKEAQSALPYVHPDCGKGDILSSIMAGVQTGFNDSSSGVSAEDAVFGEKLYLQQDACGSQSLGNSRDKWNTEETYARPVLNTMMMASVVSKETRSLLVTTENCCGGLRQNIEQVVSDHELVVTSPGEALSACNDYIFQLVWVQLHTLPSEDTLSVITAIRYSSKYNRKTIILGVTDGPPEIDFHLHGVDEILLEPVSRATIRQKYFEWTSVKLIPYDYFSTCSHICTDHDIGLKEPALPSTTPESVTSTESSSIEISLSSLASVVTNDSGIQGDADMVDLKPSPAFLFSAQQGLQQSSALSAKDPKFSGISGPADITAPSALPSWCRMEHATKEKHRRERIKDSCDQLRVLLPYVRGRKTDMASILEMTVDYLKIVNSKLPHEFHSHVLDMMTKGNRGAKGGSGRPSVSGGRGSGGRGGRGRGGRRSNPSPSKALGSNGTPSPDQQTDNFLCASGQGRMLTRSLSRANSSTSPSGSGAKGTSRPRGCKGTKRSQSSTPALAMSPNGSRVGMFYAADVKDRASGRGDTGLSGLQLAGFLQPSHHMASLLGSDGSPPSPIASTATSSQGLNSTSIHSTCTSSPAASSLVDMSSIPSAPRLFASAAHLALERLVSHSGFGGPSSMGSGLATRFSLGGERDGGSSAGGGGIGMPCAPTSVTGYGDSPGYYHYYSSMADLGSAYAVPGGGGGGGGLANGPGLGICGGNGGAGSGGDFVTSAQLLRLPTSCPSVFPSRLVATTSAAVVAPPRGKAEESDPHLQSSLTEGEDMYSSISTGVPKTGN